MITPRGKCSNTKTKELKCLNCDTVLTVSYRASRALCDECKVIAQKRTNNKKAAWMRRNRQDNKAYTIVDCDPDSDWGIGATFTEENFKCTLDLGYFPAGTKFRHGRKVVTVREYGGKFVAR